MTRRERERARALAEAWRDNRDLLENSSPEFIADSLGRRLLQALDELDRRDSAYSAKAPT